MVWPGLPPPSGLACAFGGTAEPTARRDELDRSGPCQPASARRRLGGAVPSTRSSVAPFTWGCMRASVTPRAWPVPTTRRRRRREYRSLTVLRHAPTEDPRRSVACRSRIQSCGERDGVRVNEAIHETEVRLAHERLRAEPGETSMVGTSITRHRH